MTDDDKIDGFIAVVLAGGASERMGRNKLLMEVSARPMIRHVVETVRNTVDEVIVITGHHHDRIGEALARLPVALVRMDPDLGQGATIARALDGLSPEIGALVCVGDQPRLTGREIAGVIEAFLLTDRTRAMVPVRQGIRGYPVVVPPGFDAFGLDLSADDILTTHPGEVVPFETRNPVYESSVDTPEDYRAMFAI